MTPLLEPAGRRAPDVAVWAIPAEEPGRWRIIRGEHHRGRYVETVHRTPTVTASEALTLLRSRQRIPS